MAPKSVECANKNKDDERLCVCTRGGGGNGAYAHRCAYTDAHRQAVVYG